MRPGARQGIVALSLIGIAACTSADASPSGRWVQLGRDANYTVWIDTVALKREYLDHMPGYLVWYRTDHTAPRLHHRKPFNREIVESVVACDSLWFKVRSVDMRMNDERPIALQRADVDDLMQQPWRRVELGTVEEAAAQAACHFGDRRWPRWRGRAR